MKRVQPFGCTLDKLISLDQRLGASACDWSTALSLTGMVSSLSPGSSPPGSWNHGVGSPDHIQESDISMLYYLSHSHFT